MIISRREFLGLGLLAVLAPVVSKVGQVLGPVDVAGGSIAVDEFLLGKEAMGRAVGGPLMVDISWWEGTPLWQYDNWGLRMNLGDAYGVMASSLDLEVDQLSRDQKLQAYIAAVLDDVGCEADGRG